MATILIHDTYTECSACGEGADGSGWGGHDIPEHPPPRTNLGRDDLGATCPGCGETLTKLRRHSDAKDPEKPPAPDAGTLNE